WAGAIRGGGAEVCRNRSDDADGVKLGQAGDILDEKDEQHGHDCSHEHGQRRHAPFVESLKDSGNFAIACEQKLKVNRWEERRVNRGKKKQSKDDADDDAKSIAAFQAE